MVSVIGLATSPLMRTLPAGGGVATLPTSSQPVCASWEVARPTVTWLTFLIARPEVASPGTIRRGPALGGEEVAVLGDGEDRLAVAEAGVDLAARHERGLALGVGGDDPPAQQVVAAGCDRLPAGEGERVGEVGALLGVRHGLAVLLEGDGDGALRQDRELPRMQCELVRNRAVEGDEARRDGERRGAGGRLAPHGGRCAPRERGRRDEQCEHDGSLHLGVLSPVCCIGQSEAAHERTVRRETSQERAAPTREQRRPSDGAWAATQVCDLDDHGRKQIASQLLQNSWAFLCSIVNTRRRFPVTIALGTA